MIISSVYTNISAPLYVNYKKQQTNKKKTLFYFKNNFFKRQRDRDDVYVFRLFFDLASYYSREFVRA